MTATQSIIKVTEQSACFPRPKSWRLHGAPGDWGISDIRLHPIATQKSNEGHPGVLVGTGRALLGEVYLELLVAMVTVLHQ